MSIFKENRKETYILSAIGTVGFTALSFVVPFVGIPLAAGSAGILCGNWLDEKNDNFIEDHNEKNKYDKFFSDEE